MKASIDLHLIINGTGTLIRGEFQVKKEEDNPLTAYNFLKQVRRRTGYYGNDSIIEQVIVDDKKDITDKVKEIDEAPLVW